MSSHSVKTGEQGSEGARGRCIHFGALGVEPVRGGVRRGVSKKTVWDFMSVGLVLPVDNVKTLGKFLKPLSLNVWSVNSK